MTRMDNDNQWQEFTRRAEARISHAVELLTLLEESIRYDPDPWRHYVRHHVGSIRRALVGADSVVAPGHMPELDRIVEYASVHHQSVTSYLEKGWELYGSPVSGSVGSTQAMVRREGRAMVAAGVFPVICKRSDGSWDVYWGPGASDTSFGSEADARAYISSKIRVEGK